MQPPDYGQTGDGHDSSADEGQESDPAQGAAAHLANGGVFVDGAFE